MTSGVMIDTDPGLGLPLTDVDDALAIYFLARSGLEIAGLTTTYGNASGDRTYAVAVDLGRRLGLPVHRGARHPTDTATAAVDALVAHTGTVLAIAPMTNVAAALARGAQWSELVLLGGTDRRLPNLRPLHTTELNFALDEPAAATAIEACSTLFPMEVCRTVWFGADELRGLPTWLDEGCASWLRGSWMRTGRRAFHPWDLLPAVYLVAPELFRISTCRPVPAFRRGRRGYVRYEQGDVDVAVGVDAAGLIARWADVIG